MMKKVCVVILFCMASIFLIAGCQTERSGPGGGLLSVSTGAAKIKIWDMVLANLGVSAEKYFVTVVQAGGPGQAVVSIAQKTTQGMLELGNQVVFDGVPIPTGSCGIKIVFSTSIPSSDVDQPETITAFNLALGDAWVVMVSPQGSMAFPAEPIQSSQNVAVSATGYYSCASTCPQGFYLSLPGTGGLLQGAPISGSMFPGAQVWHSDYNVEAELPEVHLLVFSTMFPMLPQAVPLVQPGDQITVQYTRRFTSFNKGGDIFRVRATNQFDFEPIEQLVYSSESATVTKTFTAKGMFLSLEFLIGLSNGTGELVLDDISISVNGTPIFTENFEAGHLAADGLNWIWMPLDAELAKGGGSFTNVNPISGAMSYMFKNGQPFHLWGQAGEFSGVWAAEFDMTKGSAATGDYFYGAFMVADIGGPIMGTYNGTDTYLPQACNESGLLFANIDSTGHADLNGMWSLSLNAQLANCDDPAKNGQFAPLTGQLNNIPVTQMPSAIGGLMSVVNQQGQQVPITDLGGNSQSLLGLVIGQLGVVMLDTQQPASAYYTAVLVGAATENEGVTSIAGQIQGSASPSLIYMYKTCSLTGTFMAQITPFPAP